MGHFSEIRTVARSPVLSVPLHDGAVASPDCAKPRLTGTAISTKLTIDVLTFIDRYTIYRSATINACFWSELWEYHARIDRTVTNLHHGRYKQTSPKSTWCVTSRHDTLPSPCILAQEKVVTCCVALVGQHGATRSSQQARQARLARHVFRGVATAWTGVDMSTSLVSRSCFCDWCKSRAQKTKLVHASATASSSSAMFMLEQARHDTHDKRDVLVTTRVTRACRVVPWHNKRNMGYIRRSFLARSSELCEPWIYIKCIATT